MKSEYKERLAEISTSILNTLNPFYESPTENYYSLDRNHSSHFFVSMTLAFLLLGILVILNLIKVDQSQIFNLAAATFMFSGAEMITMRLPKKWPYGYDISQPVRRKTYDLLVFLGVWFLIAGPLIDFTVARQAFFNNCFVLGSLVIIMMTWSIKHFNVESEMDSESDSEKRKEMIDNTIRIISEFIVLDKEYAAIPFDQALPLYQDGWRRIANEYNLTEPDVLRLFIEWKSHQST